MFFIDLDGFKQINDSRGHETGDHVLRVVADRLTGACRESDLVARLAGDEFVVFSAQLSAADSVRLARRFVERIDQPIDTGRGPVRVSGSCGFVELRPGRTATQVIEEADAAMYRAKRAGRNGISR